MKNLCIAIFIGLFTLIHAKDASMGLIDIQSVNERIKIDLKYATAENFTGQVVYPFQCCLLIQEAAIALSNVQQELEEIGIGLKVWDGYRPMAAQWKFWEILPDERYVSDPRKGGRHTRGTAVDLTLIDQHGHELPMPTSFDDFTERAHADYMGASQEELDNRTLLKAIMEKHGFIGLPTEWWHFDFVGWEQFPPLEVDPTSY